MMSRLRCAAIATAGALAGYVLAGRSWQLRWGATDEETAQVLPVRRPADHSWMLTAWVLPLVVAIGITVVTAGFGAMTIAVAIMIGIVSTLLRLGKRDE